MSTSPEMTEMRSFLSDFEKKLKDREFTLQVIDRDLLKYLALLFMTLGHWAFDIAKVIKIKQLISFSLAAQYFAPPVFFFFIAEGYHYTKSKAKYAQRLFIFAAVTQIPHALTDPDGFSLYSLLCKWSVLMTLFLGLLSLIVLHSSWKLPMRLLAVGGLMGASCLLQAEWAVGGIAIILLFDLLRERPLLRFAMYITLVFAIGCFMLHRLPGITDFKRFLFPLWNAGIVITFFYNGRKGRFPVFSKYFFYVWYPLHLLLHWTFGLIL